MTDYSVPSINESESELSLDGIEVQVKISDLPQTMRGDYIDFVGNIIGQDK